MAYEFKADLSPETLIDLAEAATLSGDIREALMIHLRGIKVPWTMLAEDERRDRTEAVDKLAGDVVRRVVGILSQQGFPHLVVRVGKWTVKDGIKLEVGITSVLENINKLAAHGANSAMLVLADPGAYIGERASAPIENDQRDLPLHGDDD
jgi:hypothetical protein